MKIGTTTEEKVVLTHKDPYGDTMFCRKVYYPRAATPSFSMSDELDEAEDISSFEEDEIAHIYCSFITEMEDGECAVRKIRTTTDVEELEFRDSTLKEVRQRIALQKLNSSDIEALGLTSVAVYIKTKYHNA